ncbi:unnamed protein product [Natator depressus]
MTMQNMYRAGWEVLQMQKPQLSRQKGTVKRILYHCVAISMADSRMVLKNYKGSPMETFSASREVVLGYQLGEPFITYKSAKRRGFHCLYLMRRTAAPFWVERNRV